MVRRGVASPPLTRARILDADSGADPGPSSCDSPDESESILARLGGDLVKLETILIWTAVGLIAGWLAPWVLGRGYGRASDIVAGLAGSLIGSLIFRTLYLEAPFGRLLGPIFVAFVGAAILLTILHLVHTSGIGRARRLHPTTRR